MSTLKIKHEDAPAYTVSTNDQIITAALTILAQRFEGRDVMRDPKTVRDYLTLKAANLQHEVFAALFLDSQNRVIAYVELAHGTIDGASVYPREVLKTALQHNTAAVIFTHNHPSGVPEPSAADRTLTERLKSTLALVDIRVLDHVVTGGASATSFAERGWL